MWLVALVVGCGAVVAVGFTAVVVYLDSARSVPSAAPAPAGTASALVTATVPEPLATATPSPSPQELSSAVPPAANAPKPLAPQGP